MKKNAQWFREDTNVYNGITQDMDTSYLDDNDLQVSLVSPEEEEVSFDLPELPGAIEVDDGLGEIEVEEPQEDVRVEEQDAWDWRVGGLSNFLSWLHNMLAKVPTHSGRDTTGLERAIAYFEALDKEITKAMRTDFNGEIDSEKVEEARAQVEDALNRLEDRLEKVKSKKSKKKEAGYNGLVKEGQKTPRIDGITVTVPLFISRIVRTLINGMVSAGHDIEEMYDKLNKKYDFTPREEGEIMQLLADMGYQMKRDRGHLPDEEYDPKSSDNFDWAANYPA